MTTIAWGPLGRAPLWRAVMHLAALEAKESPRAARYVPTEPADAVRTGPADAVRTEPADAVRTEAPGRVRTAHEPPAATRAPEIGPARTVRPPRPRTAAHHAARMPRNPPPQEPGTVRAPA
ncbi:hypothetical protein RM574_29995 [Streptomyces sp. DSM 41982]|uniref:Uncharacterized protein n=1 Tax=Streptomyces evansiae TaxID=3075535 RepID=A0ABD5EE27_9ACTN|nr:MULTISPECIES: hypothetical protein [unclassified Streptomyces]MDT0419710.1 hypothetical protein [Streptomyces sp. DSM 41982]SCE33686.1 hypothetical protein GA0115246_114725 [Streptomyces sp. SolWspMP-sol7th]